MTQFFNVQMNLQDAPQVQIEQSGTHSAKMATAGSEESFNSVLQKALPEKNSTTSLTSKEKTAPDNTSIATESSTPSNDSTLPTNIVSKQPSTPTLFQQIVQNTLENREAAFPLKQLVLDNPDNFIETLPQGQTVQNDTDRPIATLPTGQAVQNEPNTLIATLPTDQAVQNEANTPIAILPPSQTVQNETNTLIATLPTGQVVPSETNTLLVTPPTDQAVPSETNTLLVTLPTDQAVQSKTDGLIATPPQDQGVHSETDAPIAILPTGQAVQSETDTLSRIPKDTPLFFNALTLEPSKQSGLNDLLSPLNTHTKNKFINFLDSPGFGSGTKSLSDLQNATTQTNNTVAQRILSEPVTPYVTNSTQQVITPQQGALLDRLQPFINSGAETGILSIKKITSNTSNDSLRSQLEGLGPKGNFTQTSGEAVERMTTRGGDSFTALEEGIFAPSLRNKQQNLSGIRQDSNQQYFNAKVQPQNSLNDTSNPGTNQQNDGMNQQSSGFNQLSATTNKPEPGNPFTLQGTTVADPLSTQLSSEAKTTILPSGTLLHDQEVIQQLVNRFKVNRRQLESKIQLKLHPAELGKMEIDLTVKEGSIRANVVAQSQHVQEIVERNIAKLKTVLEQQGFNVEEITVTSESEMVGSFDLFDKHFNNNGSSTFLKNNDKSENNTPFVMDEFQDSYLDASTGVNVKV